MKLLNSFTGAIITVLSGDILYLYYAGAWVEPIRFIEISELVMLYSFVVLGIFLSIKAVMSYIKE